MNQLPLRKLAVLVHADIVDSTALVQANEALAHQQQEIVLLRRQLELLGQRQQEHAAQSDAGPASVPLDEKPPHY